MKAHFKYLSYVVRHKWFVFLWCLRLGVPIHRAILHDWTKFLPCEWFPYVASFYAVKPTDEQRRSSVVALGYDCYPSEETVRTNFNRAWNHHQKANPHHWQYWVLINDSDSPQYTALPIPDTYRREMVADWIGAGRAITGKYEFRAWYEKNKLKQLMHAESREWIEHYLCKAEGKL